MRRRGYDFITVSDRFGNVIAGGSVEVRDSDNALADLFDAAEGGAALSNPLTPNDNGYAEWYVAPGTYSVTVSVGAAETETYERSVFSVDDTPQLPIEGGGTGADSAAGARSNLGLGTAATEEAAALLDRANHTGTQTLATISDSGTAAAVDTGPALDQVPTGQDLSDGINTQRINVKHSHSRFLGSAGNSDPYYVLLVKKAAAIGAIAVLDFQAMGLGGSNQLVSAGRIVIGAVTGGVTGHVEYTSISRQSLDRVVEFRIKELTYNGETWLALHVDVAGFEVPSMFISERVARDGIRDDPDYLLRVLPADVSDVVDHVASRPPLQAGRPGDSIGNNGSYHDPNGSLGDSTALVLGTGPTEVPQNSDLGTIAYVDVVNDTQHGTRGGGTLHAAATGSANGFMSSGDKTKLDGVEAGAEVNQTNAEIKTQYEANADTNAFTDAEQTKLTGIEAGAEVNDPNTALTNAAQTFTAAQRASITTLTSGASITPDFAASNHFNVVLAHNATLENPTNVVAGQSGSLRVEQDATGSRTLAFGTSWKVAGGTAPALSEAAGAIDRVDYFVFSATEIHYALAKAIA